MSRTGTAIQFEYDHNGLRTKKTVTESGITTVTEYRLHGSLVTHLTRGTDSLHFYYDAASRSAFVDYNGTMYAYMHNLQGDIVGILDSTGIMVVTYSYDAWGKPVQTSGSMANTLGKINPFRYRGYVFDGETGLYYLQSRYYDSDIARLFTDKFFSAIGFSRQKRSRFAETLQSGIFWFQILESRYYSDIFSCEHLPFWRCSFLYFWFLS